MKTETYTLKYLMLAFFALVAFARVASADELSRVMIPTGSIPGILSIDGSNISNSLDPDPITGDLIPGTNNFGYFAVEFSVSATGTYALGQDDAPLDTALMFYNGSFDEANAPLGYVTSNDDANISTITGGLITNASCSDSSSLCPGLAGLSLTQGVQYAIVLTHYRPSDIASFVAPQSLFVLGPGTATFTAQGGVSLNIAPIANAGPDQTVTSAATVTLDGTGSTDADGDPLTYTWTQTSGTTVTLSDTTAAQPTFTAPTLAVDDADVTLVFSLTVNDGTVTSSADTVTITVGPPSLTPATAFAEYEEEIRATLVDDARRNLTSALSVNQRLVRDARGRMIETQQALSGCSVDETQNNGRVGNALDTFECAPNSVSTRNYVPFDVNGTFNLDGTTLSTRGNFFEQTGNYEGTQRRLFFGDFDVQHDADTDSTTATLTARVAWERMTSDNTMLGYFIGGELARSTIDGTFDGDQDRVAVTGGGYVVHQLADELYLDGFLSYGIGRNDLEMANDVLALTSDYTTRTATAGAALSGVYEYDSYEFRPELAFSYGKTWIGNVGFTGRAYGLVDDTLSLDAGTVSIANLTLRPEVVWALDGDTVAESNSQLSFAPRAICERTISTTRTENCGGGAELGLSSQSEDGLSAAEFRIIMDRVGNSNRSSYALNIEHRF